MASISVLATDTKTTIAAKVKAAFDDYDYLPFTSALSGTDNEVLTFTSSLKGNIYISKVQE